eukprot:m.102227 g.102227  ORF g.102227 m.102227 type:complete len:163 (+) comp12535_c0_seq3:900-1388(+)
MSSSSVPPAVPLVPLFSGIRWMLTAIPTCKDTHFVTRDRMGRNLAFLARLWSDGHPAIAIGIDEQTAIAIDASGKGTMLQQSKQGGRAYVIHPSGPAETCKKGQDLVYTDVPVQELDATRGDTFDFSSMTGGAAARRYTITAKGGKIAKDPYSPPHTAQSRQ